MLEDTLVVWGGEFGRTAYSQGTLTKTNYGRDHTRLSHTFQGRRFRLTDVHGHVVKDLLA